MADGREKMGKAIGTLTLEKRMSMVASAKVLRRISKDWTARFSPGCGTGVT